MTTELDELRTRAVIQEWQFRSSLPIVGPLVTAFRRFFHAIAGQWALRSFSQQQSEFNLAILNLIERVSNDNRTDLEGKLPASDKVKDRLDYLERESINADRSILQLRRLCTELAMAVRTSDESINRRLETETESWAGEISGRVTELQRLQADMSALLGTCARLNARDDEILSLLAGMRRGRHEGASHQPVDRSNLEQQEAQADRNSQFDYFLFEMQFRGSVEEIARRHERYLKYFTPTDLVLDLGCGRGEFLSLLERNGIKARGVDANADMVDYCRQKRLAVEHGDILEYLKKLEDNSVGGIFLGQVVEHLPPVVLLRLIRLAHQKLKPDGSFVVETINPTCLYALITHYLMDPSHVRPVHPELLTFLLRTEGFRVDPPLFLEPMPDNARLKRLPGEDTLTSVERTWLETLNHNVDLVNDILYGNQDYAMVARKIAWPARLIAKSSVGESLIAR
jgi:O-antigen chain-terminating methyltransferase